MDNQQLKLFLSEKIAQSIDPLAEALLTEMSGFYQYTFESGEERAGTKSLFMELVTIISRGLRDEDVKNEAFLWGETVGQKSAENNGDLGNTIKGVTIYKNVLWSFIHEEGNRVKAASGEMLKAIVEIDHLFNMMVHGFSTAFTENAQSLLRESRELYLTISVPIVPISAKVAILPLIGEINEIRSEKLIVEALETCVKKRIESLVIDLSGVHEVDLVGIEVLFKLIKSLTLLGVTPIITGMKGDISQTFVNLGIHFEGISIFSSLEQALKETGFSVK